MSHRSGPKNAPLTQLLAMGLLGTTLMAISAMVPTSPAARVSHAARVSAAQQPARPLPRKPLGTDVGQWWQLRGDRRMTGRTLVKGDITKPAVVWKHRVAARETLVSARLGAGGRSDIPLPADDLGVAGTTRERLLVDWGAAMPWGDLEGNSRLTPVQPWAGANTKLGKILPEVPGLQLVTCEPLNNPQGDPYLGIVRLKVRHGGHWVERWKTETDTLIWQAEPIFGDFDHDGRTDVALLPWYKLNVLDAETGRVTHRAAFKREDEAPELGGRAYGWFGAVDLDGQGPDEFVIIDDFTRHMAVMGWREGKLERLWNRIIRKPGNVAPPADETVAIVVNPEPVQDLDGDGRREIVVSVFNEQGDSRWHTVALSGMTGDLLHDLGGWFLSGARDLDGDGAAELLCTQTGVGLRRPDPAPLAAYTFKGGERAALWSHDGAAFQTVDLPNFPDRVNSGASMPLRTALCAPVDAGGPPVFFTRRVKDLASGAVELTAWQAGEKGQVRRIGLLTGPRLEALAVRPPAARGQPCMLLRASALDGEKGASMSGENMGFEPVLSQLVPAPMSPVVIGRMEPGAPPAVIVQGPDETVEAIRPRIDGTAERLWRVPGRTMTCYGYYEGALLADLAGDGSLAAVIGTRGDGDCARLAAVDARGRTIWRRDFPEFPGAPPPWNVPGLMYWQAGYFRDEGRMDLLVQTRRIGGETYLIDGRTGEQYWSRSHSTDDREFGRARLTVFDYNGDGREDALTNFPDVFCVADGGTGELLLKKHARDLVLGQGYGGTTVVADFLGEGAGAEQMLYSDPAAIALLRRNGTPVWKTAWDENDPCHPHHGTDVRPAPGDSDGDGRLEIYLPGHKCGEKREFHCRDAATGEIKWRLPLPGKPSEPAVADIDGDGRDECVFTIEATLYAVGATADGKSGHLEWTLALPSYTASVAIADVLGDGRAQVVLSCQDGYVYGIGSVK